MNTVSYIERKKYVRYDADSYLLYLNEAPADVVVDEESGETARGYSYTGEETDGSTRISVDARTVNRRKPPRQVRGRTYRQALQYRRPDCHLGKQRQHGPNTPRNCARLKPTARMQAQVDELLNDRHLKGERKSPRPVSSILPHTNTKDAPQRTVRVLNMPFDAL